MLTDLFSRADYVLLETEQQGVHDIWSFQETTKYPRSFESKTVLTKDENRKDRKRKEIR